MFAVEMHRTPGQDRGILLSPPVDVYITTDEDCKFACVAKIATSIHYFNFSCYSKSE